LARGLVRLGGLCGFGRLGRLLFVFGLGIGLVLALGLGLNFVFGFLFVFGFGLALFLAWRFGRVLALFGREQRAPALGAATPAGVFGLELLGVGLVDDQAVVVIELFPCFDVANGLDENAVVVFIGFAVGAQLWLIQREELPPNRASITRSSFT
jgi:hypothetical protein